MKTQQTTTSSESHTTQVGNVITTITTVTTVTVLEAVEAATDESAIRRLELPVAEDNSELKTDVKKPIEDVNELSALVIELRKIIESNGKESSGHISYGWIVPSFQDGKAVYDKLQATALRQDGLVVYSLKTFGELLTRQYILDILTPGIEPAVEKTYTEFTPSGRVKKGSAYTERIIPFEPAILSEANKGNKFFTIPLTKAYELLQAAQESSAA